MFDARLLRNDYLYRVNTIISNGVITINSTVSSGISFARIHPTLNLLPNTQYVCSFNKNGDFSQFRIYDVVAGTYFDADTTISGAKVTGNFITSSNTLYRLVLYPISGSSCEISDIMINQRSTTASYIEHKGKSFDLTLPEGMFLGSIGTASNYIYGTKDNWKLVSGLEKFVFIGNENISLVTSTQSVKHFALGKSAQNINMKASTQLALSNYYIRTTATVENRFKTGVTYAIQIYDNQFETVDEIKAWLTQKYNDGNPLYVIYEANSITEIPITDPTLISQLNNIIDNLQTYKGGTVVFTSGESLAPNIQFDYMVNPLASMQSDISDMKNAILSLGGEV